AMRGVRQRRPSSYVNRQRDTRSLGLSEGMGVSLINFEFLRFGFTEKLEHSQDSSHKARWRRVWLCYQITALKRKRLAGGEAQY
ncbi:MAG: hypothetical protein WA748_11755, partial [Candidatus Acidiferrum sp.]